MNKNLTAKKLTLRKQTVAQLTRNEMSELHGAYKACWENLWTAYHCDVIWTGDAKPPLDPNPKTQTN